MEMTSRASSTALEPAALLEGFLGSKRTSLGL